MKYTPSEKYLEKYNQLLVLETKIRETTAESYSKAIEKTDDIEEVYDLVRLDIDELLHKFYLNYFRVNMPKKDSEVQEKDHYKFYLFSFNKYLSLLNFIKSTCGYSLPS